MALPGEDGVDEIKGRAAVSLFKALGGFKGDGARSFPGPVLLEENLAGPRGVYEAARVLKGSSAWKALGPQLLRAAPALGKPRALR
ncbi:MAG: hypothetical protein LBR53_02570 [Deltaproteobacteria bacterium]|nr:hypothetical protein [Deltaproteobacteria bacterium]